jgi:hypothetical protein
MALVCSNPNLLDTSNNNASAAPPPLMLFSPEIK